MRMTHEELAAMDDRALDALVAEWIMGWKWHLCHETNNEGEMVYHFRNDEPPDWWKRPTEVEAPRLPEIRGVRLFVYLGLRHYSTDPSAAWEVVEKMRADGWGCQITLVTDLSRKNHFWAVNFCNSVGGGHECDTKSMPRAVSIAALLAVGEKGEAAK